MSAKTGPQRRGLRNLFMSPPPGTTSRSTENTPLLARRLRRLGVSGRRMRREWTGDRFREVGWTLLWVAPLTLLIWVWAQDQQIEEELAQNVPVQIEHIDGSMAIRILSAIDQSPGGRRGEGNVITPDITFQGPRIGLSSVLNQLRSNTGEPLLEMNLRLGAADQTAIDLRSELNNSPVLQEAGVSVVEVAPSQVLVRVEQRRQVEARIVPGGLQPQDLVGPVSFDPATVIVEGPGSSLDRLAGPQAQIQVIAQLPDNAPAGVRQQVTVPLALPISVEGVTLSPQTATATFTRKERRQERLELSSVPVRVEKPVPMERSWRVEPEREVLTNLVVQGPADRIEQLRRQIDSGQQPVVAVLRVERDDELQDGTIRRPVRMQTPDGINLVGESPEVSFTLRRLDGNY